MSAETQIIHSEFVNQALISLKTQGFLSVEVIKKPFIPRSVVLPSDLIIPLPENISLNDVNELNKFFCNLREKTLGGIYSDKSQNRKVQLVDRDFPSTSQAVFEYSKYKLFSIVPDNQPNAGSTLLGRFSIIRNIGKWDGENIQIFEDNPDVYYQRLESLKNRQVRAEVIRERITFRPYPKDLIPIITTYEKGLKNRNNFSNLTLIYLADMITPELKRGIAKY